MLNFSISFIEIIKFPCFMYTIERGNREWKEAQTQGGFIDNFNIYIYTYASQNI
jgi:hypothetical protein